MEEDTLVRSRLKTPRAAAIAGIVFSVLFIAAFSLLRIYVPSDPAESGEWLKTSSGFVAFALNLLPFAGIAFLWFVGALRDRLGQLEDRFFATVFLGSSLLFLAMLFVLAAIVGAMILTFTAQPRDLMDSVSFHFARTLVLHDREHLHDQDGGRFHDLDVDCGHPHEYRAPLGCLPWICDRAAPCCLAVRIFPGFLPLSRFGFS